MMRKLFSVIVVSVLVAGYIWLVVWFLGSQPSPQRVPLLVAAISSLLSALGVFASWQVVMEMRQDREAFYSPEVYADFKVLDGLFVFTIYNSGRSAAKQIKIDVQPIPIGREGKPIDDVTWFRKPINVLLPGQRLEKVVDSHVALIGEGSNRPKKFRIRLEYIDSKGKKHTKGPYSIDLSDFLNSRFLPLPVDESLTRLLERQHDIRKSIDNIERALTRSNRT